jgi:glycosyltransferase involved in cell wall biosynthesis
VTANGFSGARVAIVHDWLQGMHGGERTVEAMLTTVFADAERCDLYTFHAAHDVISPTLSDAVVRDASISRLPGIRQRGHDPGRWRLLLPYMPTWFERLPLDSYDVVLSSSHAFAVAAHPRRADVLHACYCYTPIRYVWERGIDGQRVTGIQAKALDAVAGWLRRQDLRAAARPRGHIAISSAVAERIHAAYGRTAPVVHPPVEVGEFRSDGPRDRDHFAWAHRLAAYKRPLEVVEAFRGMPDLRLTMVGVGPLADRVRSALPPNVELRDWIDRAELVDLLGSVGGFLHVGVEDFGITMAEALASGTPVVALDRGGAVDIVEDGVTGVLVGSYDVESIREGVRRLRETAWDPAALAAAAQRFSRERFARELRARLGELAAAR